MVVMHGVIVVMHGVVVVVRGCGCGNARSCCGNASGLYPYIHVQVCFKYVNIARYFLRLGNFVVDILFT